VCGACACECACLPANKQQAGLASEQRACGAD